MAAIRRAYLDDHSRSSDVAISFEHFLASAAFTLRTTLSHVPAITYSASRWRCDIEPMS